MSSAQSDAIRTKIVSLQMVKIPAKNNWLGFDSIYFIAYTNFSKLVTSPTGEYRSCNLQESQ
ncbi:hypothetical protein PA7559_12210 [Pseudoalteromonas distincta]